VAPAWIGVVCVVTAALAVVIGYLYFVELAILAIPASARSTLFSRAGRPRHSPASATSPTPRRSKQDIPTSPRHHLNYTNAHGPFTSTPHEPA
jgi:hypothetical protein